MRVLDGRAQYERCVSLCVEFNCVMRLFKHRKIPEVQSVRHKKPSQADSRPPYGVPFRRLAPPSFPGYQLDRQIVDRGRRLYRAPHAVETQQHRRWTITLDDVRLQINAFRMPQFHFGRQRNPKLKSTDTIGIAEVTAVPYRTMKEFSDRPGTLGLMMGRGLSVSSGAAT